VLADTYTVSQLTALYRPHTQALLDILGEKFNMTVPATWLP
jgi:hypothetical protein